jgi:hypothetical protein
MAMSIPATWFSMHDAEFHGRLTFSLYGLTAILLNEKGL